MAEGAATWIRRLLRYCGRQPFAVCVAIGSALVASVAAASAPVVIGRVVDEAMSPGSSGASWLVPWLAVLAGLGFARFGASMLRRIHAERVATGVEYELRTDLFAALQRLDGPQHDRLRTGQAASRSMADVTNVARSVENAPILVTNLVLAALAVAVMIALAPLLTLAALVIVPALYVITRKAAAVLFPASWDYSHRTGELAGVVESVISGIRVVKSFGRESHEQRRMEAAATAAFASGMRRTELESRYYPMIDVMPALGQVGVLALGGWLTLRGDLTLGVFVAFAAYLAAMIGMVEDVVGQLELWQTAKASFVRILEIVDARPTIRDAPDARPAPTGPPAIEFDGVTFGYDRDHPVLRDLTLRIEPGERVAFVGGTGSGKSTAVRLLARFYDPDRGAVRFGGHDLRILSLSSLRAELGLVFEDSFLFSDTVAANIAYGKRGEPAGREEVIAAARAVEAHEFISALPRGYDTVIGERGYSLSGGQRQRIALARALIGKPSVLVLDDATSAVDAGVEAEINATLRRAMRGRTTLIIAHRRSTLRLADRIAVLHRGELVDVGTHEQLMARCARYRQLLRGYDDALPDEADGSDPAARRDPRANPPAERPAGLFGGGLPPDVAAKVERLGPATAVPDLDPTATRAPEPNLTLGRLIRLFRRDLAVVLTWMVLLAACSLALPLLVRTGIDEGVTGRDPARLWWAVLLALGVVAASWYVHRRDERAFGRLGELMLWWLRVKSSAHLHRLGIDFFERESAGHLLTRMTADAEAVTAFVQAELGRALVAVLSFVGVLAVMLAIDAEITAVLLPILFLFASAVPVYRRLSVRAYDAVRERLSAVHAVLIEQLAGLRVAQLYGREARTIKAFTERAADHRDARMRAQRHLAWFSSVAELAGEIALVVVLGVGATRVVSGETSVGTIVAFTLYVTMLFAPIQQLSQAFDSYQRARVGLRRVAGLLRTPSSTPPARRPRPARLLEGELHFDNVWFAYGPGEPEALRGVTLRVAPGETVAVVGESGAGKSTLLKLAARFYDPTAGAVRVDGVDLREYDLEKYRRRLGIVPQEAYLFAGSVRDAIAYGRPDATDADVERAARAVGAHDMINGLRHGYHHPIGEGGRGLSAGQRQLIALARAQFVNPDILLLDEATAALDLATEAMVVRAGRCLAERRTTLLIAHRLTTARTADRIAVLHHGQLIEVGTHEELLAANGRYAALWRAFVGEPVERVASA